MVLVPELTHAGLLLPLELALQEDPSWLMLHPRLRHGASTSPDRVRAVPLGSQVLSMVSAAAALRVVLSMVSAAVVLLGWCTSACAPQQCAQLHYAILCRSMKSRLTHAQFYRTDVLEALSLPVPRTWEDLVTIAAAINGTADPSVPTASSRMWGVCVPHGPGCAHHSLAAIYASYGQSRGTQQGLWLDPATMEPRLDNDGMARAMSVFAALLPVSVPEPDMPHRCFASDDFEAGRCVHVCLLFIRPSIHLPARSPTFACMCMCVCMPGCLHASGVRARVRVDTASTAMSHLNTASATV